MQRVIADSASVRSRGSNPFDRLCDLRQANPPLWATVVCLFSVNTSEALSMELGIYGIGTFKSFP